MTTQISSDNIQAATLATLGSGPTVTNVQITDSSYNVLDDTAVGTSGGYIKITGTNFASGCSVIINSTNATSVTFVSSTVLNVQVPAMSAGTYIVYVVNTDGGIAIRVNGLTYSGTPSWVTGSTLPQGSVDSAISIQLSATSDSTITYALQNGSSLPTGLTLSSSGLLSGTITGLSAETTYNFTITATDVELQDSPRSFSITITVGDIYWSYVTTLLSASSPTPLPFNDDISTNNFAVTINGDTRPYNFNPYTPGYYSNYFNGTSDTLQIAPNTAHDFGTGDFTIEFWMNAVSWSSGTAALIGKKLNDASNGWQLYRDTGTPTKINGRLGAQNNFYPTSTVTPGVWEHWALVRSGTTTYWFKNGILDATGTNSVNLTDTSASLNIGFADTWSTYNGNYYLSNVRIVKGTALYTSNFTPSTTPLAVVTNTTLLTCQSNRVLDNSVNNFSFSKIVTAIRPHNPYIPNSNYSTYGSTYFDGNGDYLTVASNAAFGFGTGDFTIECWIYPTNAGAALQQFYDNRTATADTKVNIGVRTNTITYCVGSSILLTSASSSIVNNAWQHVAVVKSSGTTKIYINGTQSGPSYTDSYNFTSPAECVIATPGDSRGSATYSFAGYISNIRVTKGQAVYTANFTPPTTLLTSTANTSLLTCQTDQPVANNTFLDNSTNNLAITRAGNTTQGALSPYGTNWSNYFDGSGDVLTIASNASLAFGTGNFTVELWYFATVAPTSSNLCLYNTGTSQFFIQIRNTAFGIGVVGSTENNAFSYNFSQGVWYHIAVCRSGTTVTGFVNGTSVGTGSNSINYGQAGATIGGLTSSSQLITGYISNLRIVNGAAVYSSNFTPSTTPLQPIANTSLLTCQSPNLVDKSANNFTITKNGDVSIQKFGPFAGTMLPTPYYSASFNGTTDYLSTATSSALTIGSNQFTVELWVYHKAAGASEQYLDSASSGFSLSKNTSNQLVLSQSGVSVIFTSTGTITAGQWNHIAIVRNASNVATMYINGTASGTATVTTNFSNNYFYIGRQQAAAAAYLNGYVSTVRIVVGSAVYTANFTPPTSPLTAITNTQLLTCQSNSFIDNSSNNIVITSNGSVRPTTFNPFTVSYSTMQSYTPAVYGGSMYFDGTGDYLTIPTSSFLVPTNTYTIEFWMNPVAYPGGTNATSLYQVTNANVANFGGLLIEFYATGTIRLSVRPATGGTNVTVTATGTIPLNAWTHIAVSVNSGATTIYVNGLSAGTGTVVVLDGTQTFCSSGYLTNGYTTSQVYYNGYLSDLRVVKGQALYTSNFVPENKPLAAVKNTTLLLNGTSAGIYDSSVNADVETGSPAKLSTAIVKFSGSTSMYFDGTGSSGLWMYNNTGVNFGAGDFTVEFWIYLAADATNTNYILDFRNTVQTTAAYLSQAGATNNFAWISGSNTQIGVAFSLTRDTWVNIAICRSGTTTRIFKDGVLSTSGTDTSSYSTSTLSVATRYTDGWKTVCYISDLRITKGYARYTANFTPPTSPFQAK